MISPHHQDKFRGAVDAMLASADAHAEKQQKPTTNQQTAVPPQVGQLGRSVAFHETEKSAVAATAVESPRKIAKDRAPNLSARSGSTFSVSSLHSLNGFLSFDQDIQLAVDVQPSPSTGAAAYAADPTTSLLPQNLDLKQLSINRSPKDGEVRDRRRMFTKQNSLWSPYLEEQKMQDLTPAQRRQLFASSKNGANSSGSSRGGGGSFFFPTLSSFSLSGRSFGRDSFSTSLFPEEADKMDVQDDPSKGKDEGGHLPGAGIARVRRIVETVEPDQVGSLTPHGGLHRKKHNGAFRGDQAHVSFAQEAPTAMAPPASDSSFPLTSPPPPIFAASLSGSYSGSYSSLHSDASSDRTGELVNVPCYIGPQGSIIPMGIAPFNQMRTMMPSGAPQGPVMHGAVEGGHVPFMGAMPGQMVGSLGSLGSVGSVGSLDAREVSDSTEHDKMAHASIEEKIHHLYGDLKARLMTEFALAPSGKNNKMKNRDLVDFYRSLDEEDPEQKRLKQHFENHLAALLQERHRRHAMRQESQKKAAVRRPKGENGRFVKVSGSE